MLSAGIRGVLAPVTTINAYAEVRILDETTGQLMDLRFSFKKL